jgi:hypothetical protein
MGKLLAKLTKARAFLLKYSPGSAWGELEKGDDGDSMKLHGDGDRHERMVAQLEALEARHTRLARRLKIMQTASGDSSAASSAGGSSSGASQQEREREQGKGREQGKETEQGKEREQQRGKTQERGKQQGREFTSPVIAALAGTPHCGGSRNAVFGPTQAAELQHVQDVDTASQYAARMKERVERNAQRVRDRHKKKKKKKEADTREGLNAHTSGAGGVAGSHGGRCLAAFIVFNNEESHAFCLSDYRTSRTAWKRFFQPRPLRFQVRACVLLIVLIPSECLPPCRFVPRGVH